MSYTEFMCNKCLRYKKIELFSHSENSKQGKRHVCIPCKDRIIEAANKRESIISEATS